MKDMRKVREKDREEFEGKEVMDKLPGKRGEGKGR